MKNIENKIKQIHNRKPFLGFWDCFEYMRHANFDEIESLIVSSTLFNGKIWDSVISAKKITNDNNTPYNGLTITTTTNDLIFNYVADDDIVVEIHLLTHEANPMNVEIYKAYVETKKYQQISMLEPHLKEIRIKLETELGVSLFVNGIKSFQ